MHRILVYIAALFILASTAVSQQTRKRNWDAPSPQEQIYREGKDDIKGLGRLFLPAMTNTEYEPAFIVSSATDSFYTIGRMGSSVWLRPGKYIVKFGSGSLDLVMVKEVDIRAEDITIIEPHWACLVVNVIDETRNSIREAYEVYSIPDNQHYGVGYGADEQLGEHLQTWVLKPGLYKIVKLGEHVNTYKNFATVRLLPNELTRYTIVIDSETDNFIGSGILETERHTRKIKNWSLFSALYGSYTLNSSNDVTSKDQETSMAFVAQFDYTIRYSSDHHYFSSRGLIEEGWNMQKKQTEFRSYLDRMRLKNIYIFSFVKALGIYSRLFVETNIWKKTTFFEAPRTITFIDQNDEIIDVKRDIKQVDLSPQLSPLQLKEGIGINVMLLKTLRTNLNIRLGMGWHQNINHNFYTQVNDSTFQNRPSSDAKGPEASLVGYARISRNMMFNTELEVFFPTDRINQLDYEFENIINLRLSKNVSLDYTLRFRRKQNLSDYILTDHIVLLRYSYILF
ncbi:hypothetical protein JXJ21_16130 [candidate division KSB1 bacterium]|nr:hypothetical protein [candidate division KSB1 bacterium]